MIVALVMGFVVATGIDRQQTDTRSPTQADAESSETGLNGQAALDADAGSPDSPGAGIEASADASHEVRTAEGVTVGAKFSDGQEPVDPKAIAKAAAKTDSPVVSSEPAAGPDAAVATAEAAGEPAAPTLHPTAAVPHEPVPQTVFTDYKAAMDEAAEDRKLLFIYFHESWPNAAQRAFETLTLADLEIKEKLKRFVLLRLPRNATISHEGKRIRLLSHPSFSEMHNRQGIAILDLAHERAEYYGHVVSTFPFTPGKYYTKEALSIILDLPPGTLTQRTMIYAVRIHPEAPASTQGIFHTALADEAQEHADYQASILVQGHHQWDSRFHRINAKLPSGVVAQEVVAESWPNEGLVEACVDCVHSWRQSPGHWRAVRGRHPLFGYDIRRGRNGIWYATGIFGQRLFGRR